MCFRTNGHAPAELAGVFHVKHAGAQSPRHDKGGPPRRAAFGGTKVSDQVLGRLPWFAPFLRLVLRLRARLLDMVTSWAL